MNTKTMTDKLVTTLSRGVRLSSQQIAKLGIKNPSAHISYLRELGHDIVHDGKKYVMGQS